ncbi:hypothetical protein LLE67_04315 [Xanthomonas campestris]|uniref:virulence factor TspB C-terminal domain-related protein n=1 Tax=Xanthomonas campestris TaxID=339 RepID=UPI001E33EFD2|nr:virulence factor TspB C-terminal domain-related protein [Xanthomonas campestris]MCC5067068.1 hypothetical protein [Xanthomonas campestris]
MLPWLARVFASALVRRLAYLLAVLLLGALGVGSARAAAFGTQTCKGPASCDEGQANAACNAQIADFKAGHPTYIYIEAACRRSANSATGEGQFDPVIDGREPGGSRNTFLGASEFFGAACNTRPSQTGWLVDGLGVYCYNGCSYAYAPTDRAFVPTGSICITDPDMPEPVLDTDGDGVPDDKDAFPNDPNESQDSDGDGIGDNADTAPDDPTNGDDKQDGDEKDNKASGGGECGSPPSCSGDAIACNTNWQVWKLRCTSASVTGSPENCGTAYSCTGDSAQCTQIALLRKTACSNALQGNLDSDGDGFGVGDSANLKGIKDAITGAGKDLQGVEVPWMDGFLDQKEWSSGLGTGTCPAPIARTVTIAGYAGNVEFSFQPLCDFASLLYAVVVTLSAVSSAFIIAGVRK